MRRLRSASLSLPFELRFFEMSGFGLFEVLFDEFEARAFVAGWFEEPEVFFHETNVNPWNANSLFRCRPVSQLRRKHRLAL